MSKTTLSLHVEETEKSILDPGLDIKSKNLKSSQI